MINNNKFMDFLVELVSRLRTKKPKFFAILQWIVTILGAITGIPAWLQAYNIVLPPPINVIANKWVAVASIGFLIASQLTTQSKTSTVTADGDILKQTDAKQLPFTAKNEVVKAQINQVPNSSSTLEEIKK